jgi:hypothetical protein
MIMSEISVTQLGAVRFRPVNLTAFVEHEAMLCLLSSFSLFAFPNTLERNFHWGAFETSVVLEGHDMVFVYPGRMVLEYWTSETS